MPVTSQTTRELFIGAGDFYMDGNSLGATMENNVWRLIRTYFRPNLNGVRGPLKGTDYVQSEVAQIEVTLPEVSPTVLALAIPGTNATSSEIDGVATDVASTLAAATLVGHTNLKVTAVLNIDVGDVLELEGNAGLEAAQREFRRVTAVGTLGAGGTGVTIDVPLTYGHANGTAFVTVQSTTLAADLAVGSTNAKVASAAGLAIGDYVLIGAPGERETRELTAVGTAGAGGTGITWAQGTTVRHRFGDSVVEVLADGTTRITSTADRRIDEGDYHDFELIVPGLAGRQVRFGLRDAIMTTNAEFTAADDAAMGPRLTLESRWDPAAPGVAPWYIDRAPSPA